MAACAGGMAGGGSRTCGVTRSQGPTSDHPPSFASLGIPSDIHGKLAKEGLLKPTAVQAAAIPALLASPPRDMLLFSETGAARARAPCPPHARTDSVCCCDTHGVCAGSGKTHAFALPLMAKLVALGRANEATVRLSAVVVSPTRELAHQLTASLQALVLNQKAKKRAFRPREPLVVRKVVGAVTPRVINSLQLDPPHVVVGTPQTVRTYCPPPRALTLSNFTVCACVLSCVRACVCLSVCESVCLCVHVRTFQPRDRGPARRCGV